MPIPTTVALQLSMLQISITGVATAGEPIEPIEQSERVDIHKSMVGRGDAFALLVKGTSMLAEVLFRAMWWSCKNRVPLGTDKR